MVIAYALFDLHLPGCRGLKEKRMIGKSLQTRIRNEFEISAELVKARMRAGLSQAELAARMGTSQSTIARLESGQTLPSTKTLLRYAQATGSRFHVRLSAA